MIGEKGDPTKVSKVIEVRMYDNYYEPSKFEIKKKGYAPLTYDLLVNPAQAIELDFFLNPIYECKFVTEEKSLIFELNGEHQWDAQTVRLRLEAGSHKLRVFKIGEINMI